MVLSLRDESVELDPMTIAVNKFTKDFSASMAAWFEAMKQTRHSENQMKNQVQPKLDTGQHQLHINQKRKTGSTGYVDGNAAELQTQIHFNSSPYEDPGTQFSKLIQTTSVAAYEVQFQLLATRIYGLSESFLMGCFINGLKDEIQCEVFAARPYNLHHAISLAKLCERKLLDADITQMSPKHATLLNSLDNAYCVFDEIPRRDKWSKKVLICGYTQGEDCVCVSTENMGSEYDDLDDEIMELEAENYQNQLIGKTEGDSFAFEAEDHEGLLVKLEDPSPPYLQVLDQLDQSITKNATLTNEKEVDAHPIKAMKFFVSPVMGVAVQRKVALDRPKLVEGLKRLAKSDPLVVCTTESEFASVTCLELGEMCKEVGLPPGILNILTGLGPEAGAPLASHPHVDKIAFTGSSATGSKVMTAAAQQVKPVTLELGGKSPILVFEDVDQDKAAEWTIFGCFWTNGQICSATSRLLVHESIAAEFLDKLVKRTKNIKISDPLEEGCRLGPVVSGGQYEKVMEFISTTKKEGATILCGGARPKHLKRGFFTEPTIISNVTTSMQIWREEVFGPVLCVKTFRTEDEAIELANDTRYGMGGAEINNQNIRIRTKKTATSTEAGIHQTTKRVTTYWC